MPRVIQLVDGQEVPANLLAELQDMPNMSDMYGDLSGLSIEELIQRTLEVSDRHPNGFAPVRRHSHGCNGVPTCSHPGCTETHGLVSAPNGWSPDSDDDDDDSDDPIDDTSGHTPPDIQDSIFRETAERIYEYWQDLKAVLLDNEDKIRKRWTKKTSRARREMLLRALPWMAKYHRPDFRAFRRGTPINGRRKMVAAYGLPHINLEDFSRPRNLLLMLESRGRFPPNAFFQVEWRASQLGREAMFAVNVVPDRLLAFHKHEGPATYGEPCDITDDGVEDLLYTGRAVPYGQGFFIMDCQDVLYKFLLDISLLIIGEKEVPQHSKPSGNIGLQPFPMPAHADLLSPVALAAESMYLAPAKINIDRLIGIVQGALSESEDHICFVREDPGYYYETMMDWFTHRQEHILDENGKKHPKLQADNKGVWEPVVRNATRMPFIWLESWAAIHTRLVALRTKQETYAHLLAEGDVPNDYALDICKLKYHCSRFMTSAAKALKDGFMGSPPMRPYLQRMPPASRNDDIRLVKEMRDIQNEDMKILVFLIDMIVAVCEKQENRDVMLQIDEVQRLIEDSPAANTMFTSWTLQQLSQASILSQCIHELDLAYPYKLPDHKEEIHADFIKTADEFVEDGGVKIFDARTLQLAMPTTNPSKFTYPVNKRRTPENVEQMCIAEENLDAVWKAMDHELSRYPVFTPRVRALLATRRKQRTVPWDEARDGKQQESTPFDESQPLSEIHFELRSRTERTIGRDAQAAPKLKAKTKGTSQQPEAQVPVAAAPEVKEVSFLVDRRALKALRTVLFVPSMSSLPGEVAWTDFCHALASTGFSAEKMYGSVWQFTPTNLDVENPISFHEPHPSGKIPFVVARRHGRRLARNYGWHIGMFKLKEAS